MMRSYATPAERLAGLRDNTTEFHRRAATLRVALEQDATTGEIQTAIAVLRAFDPDWYGWPDVRTAKREDVLITARVIERATMQILNTLDERTSDLLPLLELFDYALDCLKDLLPVFAGEHVKAAS